jgi:hypothetical protein
LRLAPHELHPPEIGAGRFEPWDEHVGIAVGTDQEHRPLRRAPFAARIGSAGGHCRGDARRQGGFAAAGAPAKSVSLARAIRPGQIQWIAADLVSLPRAISGMGEELTAAACTMAGMVILSGGVG